MPNNNKTKRVVDLDQYRQHRAVLRALDETLDATALLNWAEQTEQQILQSLEHLRTGLALIRRLNGSLDAHESGYGYSRDPQPA